MRQRSFKSKRTKITCSVCLKESTCDFVLEIKNSCYCETLEVCAREKNMKKFVLNLTWRPLDS